MTSPRMKAFRELAAAYPRLAFNWRVLKPGGGKANADVFDRDFDQMVERVGPKRRIDPAQFFRRLHLRPPVVIDIGVAASGTPWLYSLFPDARFVLYDPQQNLESRLQNRPARYDLVEAAMGAAPGSMTLNADGGHSSLHTRTELTKSPRKGRTYPVEIRTLDDEIDRLDLPPGMVVKIDSEGHELEVVRGLDRNRDKVDCVLCEVSVLNRFEGGYTFEDFVLLMRDRGFRFYGSLTIPRAQLPTRFMDCVFLKPDHPAFDGTVTAKGPD